MKITSNLIEEFVSVVPLNKEYNKNKKLINVSVHSNFIRDADDMYGRKTVDSILKILVLKPTYQKLLC